MIVTAIAELQPLVQYIHLAAGADDLAFSKVALYASDLV